VHFFTQTLKSVHCPVAIPFNKWTKFVRKFEIWTKFMILGGPNWHFRLKYFFSPYTLNISMLKLKIHEVIGDNLVTVQVLTYCFGYFWCSAEYRRKLLFV